ncbi:MAG: flavin reductase family protein [Dehalococcoidales bacterium]|jgi:ferric-chelate reductase [NAD(P)H]|nr:flavin reductase family protein [Dehalococcoidales bacterium]
MALKALRNIGYGLYVIGSKKGDKLNAQVANTVFQVTSEPASVAVSLNKNNLTHEYIDESKVFSASVLCTATPLAFIGLFGFRSGRDVDKLDGVAYKIGKTGAPVILDNAVACFEARVTQQIEVGTHTILIGEVMDAETVSKKNA